jgi:peptidoglycan/xylan/chitin deacetylase (PgdA/CDA1 family)
MGVPPMMVLIQSRPIHLCHVVRPEPTSRSPVLHPPTQPSMRIDRAITLGMVRPIRATWQRIAAAPSVALPILMYHSISDTPESAVSPYYRVCTSPGRFAEQMAWLAENGWRGMTLREGLATLSTLKFQLSNLPSSLSSQSSIPPNPSPPSSDPKLPTSTRVTRAVAITFDDGFRDFSTAAYPALARHGFSATMYLPTAYIGDERRQFKARDCLTWSEVRELRCAGMEFGSHTVSHTNLVDCSWAEIRRELQDSRSAIEQEIGAPVESFGYPYAFPQAETNFVRRFRELLVEASYTTCVTTTIGRTGPRSDLFGLPRLPANSADDPALLEAKINGAYDWMALPQFFRKRSRFFRRSLAADQS